MATKKKSTEVAVTTDEKPSYLQALEGQGALNQDNFDQSDVVVPRIKLLQGTSTELELHDHAKSGHFWHTGFEHDLGEEVRFVVASRKKKYLLVTPLEDGQGVLARAEDFVNWDRTGSWEVKLPKVKKPVTWEITDRNVVKSGLDQWGTYDPNDEDSPPAATMFYEYLVLLPDHLDFGPAVLSLARSQIKTAKKGLNDKIALHQSAGRPMQALVFKARCMKDQNESGQAFNNFLFAGDGFASEELYKQAMELKDVLSSYRVHDEGDDTAAAQTGAAESSEF